MWRDEPPCALSELGYDLGSFVRTFSRAWLVAGWGALRLDAAIEHVDNDHPNVRPTLSGSQRNLYGKSHNTVSKGHMYAITGERWV